MTSRNDITGDSIQTKKTSDAFRDGWERIFGKKKEEPPREEVKDGPLIDEQKQALRELTNHIKR